MINSIYKALKMILCVITLLSSFLGCSTSESVVQSEPSNKNEEEHYFFIDDFETGDHNKSENGFIWSGNTVPIAITPNGTKGLVFSYGPDTLTEDSSREQRFKLGKEYNDLWIKYDLYIPDNFYHRCPMQLELENINHNLQAGDKIIKVKKDGATGNYIVTNVEAWGIVRSVNGNKIIVESLPHQDTFIIDSTFRNETTKSINKVTKYNGFGHNNKFFVLWQGMYGHVNSGNAMNLSTWFLNRGSSTLSYSPAKDHGEWNPGHFDSNTVMFDKVKDAGRWLEIIIHIKVSDQKNNNGVVAVYKDGIPVLEVTNLPNYSRLGYNYFTDGYILGWANTGYWERTTFYVDNIVFSTGKISSKIK